MTASYNKRIKLFLWVIHLLSFLYLEFSIMKSKSSNLTLLVHTEMLYNATAGARWTAECDLTASTVLLHTPTLPLLLLFWDLNCDSCVKKKKWMINNSFSLIFHTLEIFWYKIKQLHEIWALKVLKRLKVSKIQAGLIPNGALNWVFCVTILNMLFFWTNDFCFQPCNP